MQQTQKGRQQFTSWKKNGQVLHWNKFEELAFVWFLLINLKDIYQKDSNRVKKRLFTLMSEFIPSRKPTQCRTHFSRLIKEKEENGDIKAYLSKKIFSCFCCQKNPSKAILSSIQEYLKTQKIQNQIFIQNLAMLNSNIQQVYQVGKQQLQGHHHFSYDQTLKTIRQESTNQNYEPQQNLVSEGKSGEQRKLYLFEDDFEMNNNQYHDKMEKEINLEEHQFDYGEIIFEQYQ